MAKRKNKTEYPDHVLDSLARVLYKPIMEYLQSGKGKRDYEEWRKEKKMEKNKLTK